jgi:hypothetical protein
MFVVVLLMCEQGFLVRTLPRFGAVVYHKGR